MEWTVPICSFKILNLETILYLSLGPKNFDLAISNPKLERFVNNWKIIECSIPFQSRFY